MVHATVAWVMRASAASLTAGLLVQVPPRILQLLQLPTGERSADDAGEGFGLGHRFVSRLLCTKQLGDQLVFSQTFH
jgi:hypothetical protein